MNSAFSGFYICFRRRYQYEPWVPVFMAPHWVDADRMFECLTQAPGRDEFLLCAAGMNHPNWQREYWRVVRSHGGA